MTQRLPRVVAIGGGHGLAVTIRAVRRYAGPVTAVVSTADDGGSTGRLRSGMGIPAPGDLRRCLVAMAGAEDTPLGRAFEFRFGGTDVEGHALGNLLVAGLDAVTGDFLAAIDEAGRLLGLDPGNAERRRVLPATVEPVQLCASTIDGESVAGQVAVATTAHVARVRLEPAGVAAPEGLADAIHQADQVVLGPGSLYTSVLAAAVVDEIRSAVIATRARRVYVCNLRAESAETKGYDVADHVTALRDHGLEVDAVVVDPSSQVLGGPVPGREQIVLAEVAEPGAAVHDPQRLASVLAGLLP